MIAPLEGEIPLATHPLIERSQEREVRQAKGFREAAQALTGEVLSGEFDQEQASAPNRTDAGKKHLVSPNSRLAAERKASRDPEHAAIALVHRQQNAERGLLLPDDIGTFEAIHAGVVLKSGPADKAAGASDPNFGIDKIDVAGIGPEDRLCLGVMKFVAPGANRVGTGDTPLRALLEGLAHTAVTLANRDAVVGELAERSGREFADTKPYLMLIGSQRYWELCRKREAQKGAGWIRELERLAVEVEEATGVTVLYLALRVNSDPGWNYDNASPEFDGDVRLLPAWEHGAGRIKPKAKPRSRRSATAPIDEIVEADLDRPIRGYLVNDYYSAGDRIEHPTLGLGVVQGIAGTGKIRVHFDERKSVLVHDRAGLGA
jgi:hypothetical protein